MKFKFLLTSLLFFGTTPLLFAQPEHRNLRLRAEPAHFSPNKDSLQDQIFFYPVLQTNVEILRWRLDIGPAGKKRLVRLTGAGLPALVKWDGLDKKGAVVPNGAYTAKLQVTGRKKNFYTEVDFAVDTIKPEVSLRLSTAVVDKEFLSGKTLEFRPGIFDSSPIERWFVQIIDESGRTVQLYWSTGAAHPVAWDGKDRVTKVLVPQGSYRAVLQAWDQAGNESPPAFADITVALSAREMLEQALHNIQVIETALGLIVQLNREDMFDEMKGKIFLHEAGRERLREVAILINAYPDVTVKLDGYSKATKAADKDRDLGSIQAWGVYSYLVKTGNVKASRLTVRGRGRSAMFDRRAVVVPFIRNGVEIILEGDRAW